MLVKLSHGVMTSCARVTSGSPALLHVARSVKAGVIELGSLFKIKWCHFTQLQEEFFVAQQENVKIVKICLGLVASLV